MRGTVTLKTESYCGGGQAVYHGRVSTRARAELKDLVAAMGRPNGKGHGMDGPRFSVRITRADGHFARQGGAEFGDWEHDENARDIAEALDRTLRRSGTSH